MIKTYNLLVAVLVTFSTQAQLPDWAWASAGIGSSDEKSTRMCVDASGNVFITGMFTSSSATFASNNVVINSGASSTGDFFLAKYDGSGTLLWLRTASGTGYDKGLALATDPSGNCYVAGSFESSSITFGAVTLTNTSTVSEIFVAKYNSSGTLLWAKAYGGQLQDQANGIAADASGNCYITGTFYSLSVLFDSYGVINSGSSDAFVTKLDANGLAQWTDQIGGSLADEGYDIKVDASGVYVVGAFSSPTLAAYTPNMVNAGASDIFFAKYDSNGNVLYAKQIGGANDDNINSLALDPSSNIYMTGYFESSSLNLGSVTINNTVTRSMMVAKYNSGGTVQWANAYAGNQFSYPDGIVTDNSGNLYISGSFNLSSLSFGTSTVSNSSSSLNGFLTKLNASTGSSSWVLSVGSIANEEINAVATDQAGSIFLTGTFGPTLTLGNFPLNGLTAPDLFIGKMCLAPVVPNAVTNITVCNKSSAVLTATPPPGSTINWYNAASGGTLLLATSNTYTASSTGTFYVEAKSTAGCVSQSRAVVTFSVLPGASVSTSGKTLTASAGNSYTWIECFKDSVLTSQTSQTMVLPYTGHYAVIVNANGCIDTSACNFYSVDATTGTVIVTGITTQEFFLQVSVFPNPNNGSFTIYSERNGVYLLMNELGQIIKQVEINPAHENRCVVEGLSEGFYFLTDENRVLSRKILVMK